MVSRSFISVVLLFLAFGFAIRPALADDIVYDNALEANWANWSWGSTTNLSNNAPAHSGTSIAIRYDSAWAAVYLHRGTTVSGSSYTGVRFYVHGGTTGGQDIVLIPFFNNGPTGSNYAINNIPANTWTEYSITMAQLGNPATIDGIVLQDANGTAQPYYYIDDMTLLSNTIPDPPGTGPALTVDVTANRHAISDDIYGTNFTDEAFSDELDLPVRRRGGNATTRYNYLNDTSNRGMDWYFENIPEPNGNVGALPVGSEADRFVEQDRRTGTKTIMTIPMIGWTPKSRVMEGGFRVSKYGPQTSVDPWWPDFGNGRINATTFVTGNDPLDTSVAIGPTFVQGWIAHLVSQFGNALGGGVKFYNLDNEPELWNDTHRDVFPNPLSYDEIRNRTYIYGAAVKAADSTAKTLGPVAWGWTGYFYSALDWHAGGSWWNNPADRNAHGGTPFIQWYLQQMKAYEDTTGTRILDYMDLHYYPQQTNVALNTAGDAARQELRLRATRSLWDPTYTDESWIGEPVRLIPRMRDWVNTYYPGTKTAITEYNFGGLEHINGALAQADVLGVFGREQLDLACHWAPPTPSQPGAYAFRIFRNYDGTGKKFGNTSVQASSGNQGTLSIYAAQRVDNYVTVAVINKTSGALTSTLSLQNFAPATTAEVYRYSTANLNAIVHEADATIASNAITASYPANSITLLEIAPAVTPVSLSVWATE